MENSFAIGRMVQLHGGGIGGPCPPRGRLVAICAVPSHCDQGATVLAVVELAGGSVITTHVTLIRFVEPSFEAAK